MPLPRPLCTRLPVEIESILEQRFYEQSWGPSEGIRAIILEWLALENYPQIEFRETSAGRRSALRAGPEVWEIAASSGPSRAMSAAVGQCFAGVRSDALEEALSYARAHRDEIDPIVARADRIAAR